MDTIKNIIENNPELVKAFLSGEGSYEMDEIVWDYYYSNGTIKNYDYTDVSSLYEQFVSELEEVLAT
jgi:hypothetical protein